MIRRPARVMAVTLAALGVASFGGCASPGGPSGGDPFTTGAEDQEIQIKIVNLNFLDATVWALIAGGRRQRLGVVSGKREAVFTLPWRFSEPLSLEFDLVAGPRCITENLTVDPGDLLELQIASDISRQPGCR